MEKIEQIAKVPTMCKEMSMLKEKQEVPMSKTDKVPTDKIPTISN